MGISDDLAIGLHNMSTSDDTCGEIAPEGGTDGT